MIDTALKLSLIFSCSLLLIMAIKQLARIEKTTTSILLLALLSTCFIWATHGTLYALGFGINSPQIKNIYIPFHCAAATIWYLYVKSLIGELKITKRTALHVIPTSLCIALLITCHMQTLGFELNNSDAKLNNTPMFMSYWAIQIANASNIAYLIMTCSVIWQHHITESESYCSLLVKFITSMAILASTLWFIGVFFDHWLIRFALPCVILSLCTLLFYGHTCRNLSSLDTPFSKLLLANKPNKQKGDFLLLETYRQRIVITNLHLDAELSLSVAAEQLGTTAHQLSELVNQVLHCNFKSFINELRIKHAETLLQEDLSLSVLDIAFASGFNSKSAFYRQFLNQHQTNPSQYRNTFLAHKEAQQGSIY